MISAWDVYWVMQLDSIGMGLGFSGLILIVFGSLVFYACVESDDYRGIWIAIPSVALAFIFWIGNAFLPSSKTAAAMYIVPRLTSGEAIEAMKPEARELYELAKDAIRELATDKKRKGKKE